MAKRAIPKGQIFSKLLELSYELYFERYILLLSSSEVSEIFEQYGITRHSNLIVKWNSRMR